MRPRTGPGTPFFEDAPEGLRVALDRFDLGGGERLPAILAESRTRPIIIKITLLCFSLHGHFYAPELPCNVRTACMLIKQEEIQNHRTVLMLWQCKYILKSNW